MHTTLLFLTLGLIALIGLTLHVANSKPIKKGGKGGRCRYEFANITTTTEGCVKTFQATAAALAQGIRVKVDSAGKMLVAGASDAAIGVTIEAVAASGYGAVKLFTGPGTFILTAGVAITRGDQVYPAAAGKIAATGTTLLPLVALEAATADGDLIECAVVYKGA
jgi:hypothetical protein